MMNDTDIPMKPSEVAKLFGVDPKTIQRWARGGKIPSFRTLGGHRRFSRHKMLALAQEKTQQ